MTGASAKHRALESIRKEIVSCRVCKRGGVGKPVPGEGNPTAKIVFIGEAPGRKESESGLPFVGRSGKLLRETIRQIGLDDESDVYITSPVKYLPKTGTPTPAQITHGRNHLLKQLAVIKPQIIVLMGRVAALGVLNENIAVSKLHGQSRQIGRQIYFFSYHPAAAIRFFKFRKVFLADFKKLKKLLN
jgi:uracil-DNA glycosylase family 4